LQGGGFRECWSVRVIFRDEPLTRRRISDDFIDERILQMRISSYGPRRLVMDSIPWGMGAGIVLAVLIMTHVTMRALLRGDLVVASVVGLSTLIFPGAMFVVLTREQLVLDRDRGEVVIRRRNHLRGLQEDRYPLGQLRGTSLQWSDSPRRHRMWRMNLVFGPPQAGAEADLLQDARLVPPVVDWGDEGTAWRRARVVEAWLAGEAQPRFGKGGSGHSGGHSGGPSGGASGGQRRA
jgi:uncharacterized membrane protein YgcG